jgi:hypothetical protein
MAEGSRRDEEHGQATRLGRRLGDAWIGVDESRREVLPRRMNNVGGRSLYSTEEGRMPVVAANGEEFNASPTAVLGEEVLSSVVAGESCS